MIKYRYARVKCTCGITHNDVPRYKTGEKKCTCGAVLRTEKLENGDEQPWAEVPDNYQAKNPPAIVGWA